MGTLAKDSKVGLDRALIRFEDWIYGHPLTVRLGPGSMAMTLAAVGIWVIVAVLVTAKAMFGLLF